MSPTPVRDGDSGCRDSGRPVIAVIANDYSDFRRPMVERIANRLNAQGFGVLCVVGGALQPAADASSRASTPASVQTSDIYEAVLGYDVRGVIIISVTLDYRVQPQRVISLVRRFAHLPLVSLGVDVPEVCSTLIDNQPGMHDLMRHMTRDPQRQRFAFIRGWPDMNDSRVRESVFRQVLAERGIRVDESLMINGNFLTADAYNGMNALLQRTHDIDAVVAASDVMAISAIHALNEHGLSVPDDVIVSGFDDRPQALDCSPPLTTVSYNFQARADVAVDTLVLQISETEKLGQAPPPLLNDGQLVIRDSSVPYSDRQGDTDKSLAERFDATGFRQQLIESLATVRPAAGVDVEAVIDAVMELLIDGSSRCENCVEEGLMHARAEPDSIQWWKHLSQQLGALLRHHGHLGQSPRALPRLSAVQAHIQGAAWSIREKARFESFKYLQLQDHLFLQLAACSSLDEVGQVLDSALVKFGIRRAYVVLYDEPAQYPRLRGRLLFCHSGAEVPELHDELFQTRQVLPVELAAQLETGLLVLSPLCSGREHLGYLLIDPSGLVPLNIYSLAQSISSSVGQCCRLASMEEQTRALSSSNSELQRMANFDPLTGLANRHRFHALLPGACRKAAETDTQVALLFFDLDGFKRVNDSMGHSSGDCLLTIVAERLQGLLRAGDLAARLGGDEFTIVIEQVRERTSVMAVAERVLQAMRQPFELESRMVSLSASVGIAWYPEHGTDPETLLRNADTAMYHAKATGKNGQATYTHTMNEAVASQLRLDQAMREGLRHGEFSLQYQPRVNLCTGALQAFEALMRWHPDDREAVPGSDRPDEFIRVAEETGFIVELDSFALEQACKQVRRWAQQGFPARVSVNMSVLQLAQPGIVDTVAATVARYGIAPQLIELEITESAAMKDVTSSIEKISAFQALGIEVSIDDFGTGYSSLNYLKRLPVSSLKIDKSFLEGITRQADLESVDASIIRAVVGLGKSMQFNLIAEGVENEVQRSFLIGLGCHEAQGFLYSPALDSEQASSWLRHEHRRRAVSVVPNR